MNNLVGLTKYIMNVFRIIFAIEFRKRVDNYVVANFKDNIVTM